MTDEIHDPEVKQAMHDLALHVAVGEGTGWEQLRKDVATIQAALAAGEAARTLLSQVLPLATQLLARYQRAFGSLSNGQADALRLTTLLNSATPENFCSTCGPLDSPGVHNQRDCSQYVPEAEIRVPVRDVPPLAKPERLTRGTQPRTESITGMCPDGGTCHHGCSDRQHCFRVEWASPLSAYGEVWSDFDLSLHVKTDGGLGG